jgi:hypothetical protein
MPDHTDEANLFSNGYLSDWDETPNGMPDGVFKSTGYEVPSSYRATGLRNTNPARVQLGTKSLRLRRARFGFVATGTSVTAGASAFSATGSSSTSATEPDFEPGAVVAFGSPLVETVTVATATYDAPNTRWNYTITGTFAISHAAGVLLQEYGLTPKHRFIMPPSGSVNLFASMFMEGPSDNSVTHTGRLVVSRPIAGGTTATVDTAVVNQWATVQVEGFQAPPGAMIEVQVQIVGSANERYSLWLDHIYAIESVDPEYFPATPPNYSNGNALYQAARRFLVERVNGVHTYDVRFIDLTRLDEGTWPNDAVLIGSYVRYTDPDTGQAVLLRMLEVRTNHLMEAETSVTLSNNPYTLTSQVA